MKRSSSRKGASPWRIVVPAVVLPALLAFASGCAPYRNETVAWDPVKTIVDPPYSATAPLEDEQFVYFTSASGEYEDPGDADEDAMRRLRSLVATSIYQDIFARIGEEEGYGSVAVRKAVSRVKLTGLLVQSSTTHRHITVWRNRQDGLTAEKVKYEVRKVARYSKQDFRRVLQDVARTR